MAITMNDLTISPEGLDRDALLEDWGWAMEEPMLPVLITALGDAFAQGQSGAVYYLDATGGTIDRVAGDGQEFQGLLSDSEFVTERMFPARVVELRQAGLTLAPGEVYCHKHPLVLGGEDTLDNYEVASVKVHMSMMGQVHRQVKDLPPGASISEIKIV